MVDGSVYLMLWITSFTPAHDITVRRVFIPFADVQSCEAAESGAVMDFTIGGESDVGSCVTYFSPPPAKKWPDR